MEICRGRAVNDTVGRLGSFKRAGYSFDRVLITMVNFSSLLYVAGFSCRQCVWVWMARCEKKKGSIRGKKEMKVFPKGNV